jgi:NADPH2:quinone reductase
MRAIVVTRLGGPEVLTPAEVPLPVPGPGEVRVALRAIGVNFADTERRRGVYGSPALPWIPGNEGAGVVDALGAGADPALLGARVAFWAPRTSGTYATHATVAAEHVLHFPAEAPFAQMAALPLQGLTAWGVVHLAARVSPGQTVLLHAAAGGVGRLALQLCLRAGARVFGTGSSEAKRAEIERLGGVALPYGEGLLERVRALTGGRGVDLVLDSVGRDTSDLGLAALAPFGTLLFFGEASGAPPPIAVDGLYPRSVRVGAFGLDTSAAPAAYAGARERLAAALCDGSLSVVVGKVYALEEAAAAHRALEGRGTIGKLILDPSLQPSAGSNQ